MGKQWAENKDNIVRLYKVENKTLNQVREIMKEQYGFEAS
jgi:hypothetical protein